MQIASVRIRGFRTIREELQVPVRDMTALVGPNNSGKTNTLRAIRNFFTGHENRFNYNYSEDICKGGGAPKTNIQLDISDIHPEADEEIHACVQHVRDLLNVEAGDAASITLYLTFSASSNPSYRVYPNVRRPGGNDAAAYSRAEKRLFKTIFDNVSIHYIPSEKSVVNLYDELVQPYLLERAYDVIQPHIAEIEGALAEISGEVNDTLAKIGLERFSASFSLPSSHNDFLKSLQFSISDENHTSAFSKGMGIQSVALLSCFCWIAKREKEAGKLVLWLLEEPESYLHPELAAQSFGLLRILSEYAQVIFTTHSLAFVPQDPEKVIGMNVADGWTQGERFPTYKLATEKIRKSLGVKFSDFFNLSRFNILVEGQTDRMYFKHIIGELRKDPILSQRFSTLTSDELSILDFGGTPGLEGFMKAAFEYIKEERRAVCVLDGDVAGDRTRRNLQGYFGNKQIPFQPNRDFLVVRDRFSIEGLVPDAWVIQIQQDHPGWFDDFAVDAQGEIMPFRVRDSAKSQYFRDFQEKARVENFDEWRGRWEPVLNALEEQLNTP